MTAARVPYSASLGTTRSIGLLAGAALLVAALSLGRAIFVPLALAAIISFILMRPVVALERRGVPRLIGVAAAVFSLIALAASFGYVLTRQVSDFATRLPHYSASIKSKLSTLRDTRQGAIGRIQDSINRLSVELEKPDGAAKPAAPVTANTGLPPQRVDVVTQPLTDMERLRSILQPFLESVSTVGIVLILVIFALMKREDIRNRFIRLAGQGRVTVTTRTLDEASQRISQFLATQLIVNLAFGVCITVGLLVIGVPFAVLWGVIAAFLRFVPYLGSLLSMLMPAALAFVGSQGWGATMATVSLFFGLDALVGSVIEPVWMGTRTGVSSLALLVSAMFWVWLWGPIGLVLSTPMTVCLAVVGRHVPELEFLAILLGDDPPLRPEIGFYQRLLAADEEEATNIVEQALLKSSLSEVFDLVIGPTLVLAERDRLRGAISDTEHRLVVQMTLEIVRGMHGDEESSTPPRQRRILGAPARSSSDEVGLLMLDELTGENWVVETATSGTLASEILSTIERTTPDVLCIVALPPSGMSQARYICKRVRARFPALTIWVLRAGITLDPAQPHRLIADGASLVFPSFLEAAKQLGTAPPVAPVGH